MSIDPTRQPPQPQAASAPEPEPEPQPEGTALPGSPQPNGIAPGPQAAEAAPLSQANQAAGGLVTGEPSTEDTTTELQPNGGEGKPQRDTIPLLESAAPPVPPLNEKDLLDNRYRVVTFLGTSRATNIYRVQDMEGYRQCWACGSTASVEGETYCVDCGAQLTGRFYRLQEFNMPPVEGLEEGVELGDIAIALLPRPILENEVPGLAHVYDFLADADRNRAYVVWEEVYGRLLSAWLPNADPNAPMASLAPPGTSGQLPSIEELEDEQALLWMSQAASILEALHSYNIASCDLGLHNYVVQPGDRLALVDPAACRTAGDDEAPELQKADIRALATALQGWYIAVREEPETNDPAQQATGAMVADADESTGPLGTPSNPTVVLTRAREGAYASAQDLAQELLRLYEARKPANNLLLISGRASDVGRVRQINEDSVLALEATIFEHETSLPVGLYVIADGMGGHQSGEVASSIAARTIGAVVNSSLIAPLVAGDPVNTSAAALANLLQSALVEANRRIYELAHERHSDLGTTATIALIVGSQLTVANVGDSRTYILRGEALGPVTRDHSLVAQLVAAGQIGPEEIYTHPRRNEIYRALGDPHLTEAEIDTFSHRLQPGDGVLLCSDGLWDFVRDPDIKATLTGPGGATPQTACEALVDQANMKGGEDNISTIFVRIAQMPRDK